MWYNLAEVQSPVEIMTTSLASPNELTVPSKFMPFRRIEQRQAVDDRPPAVLMREVQQVLRVDCDHNNFFYEPHHSIRAREILGL